MSRHLILAFKARMPSFKIIAALIMLQKEEKGYIYEWSKQIPDIAIFAQGDRLCINMQASSPFKYCKVIIVGLPPDTIKSQLASIAADIAQLRLSHLLSTAHQCATFNATDDTMATTPPALPVAQSYCVAAEKPASPLKPSTVKDNS